jgi:hypothetical protein
MMIRRDGRTLDLAVETADADAFQIAHTLKHLPDNLQPALLSDREKLAAFLPLFFEKITHPKGFDFCYAYQIQQVDRNVVLTILTHKKPETTDDFYALALAINQQALYDGKNVMVGDEQYEPADEHQRRMLIFSLLQDAALAGHERAQKVLATLKQDAEENNYLSISQLNFLYSYKNTPYFIFLPAALTTPVEFYNLANDALLEQKLVSFMNQVAQRAHGQQVNEFMYSVLSDAAKAGHAEAKRQLIDATIAGNAAARKFVTFARYNPDLPILLPRHFESARDFYKLSISLITHGKYIMGHGCALEGPFYIVPEGNRAEKLGYQLRRFADKLQRDEDARRKTLTHVVVPIVAEEKVAALAPDASQHWTNHWMATESAFFKSEPKAKALCLTLETDDVTSVPMLGIKSR